MKSPPRMILRLPGKILKPLPRLRNWMLNHFELRQAEGSAQFSRSSIHSDSAARETPRPRRDRIACRCTGGFHCARGKAAALAGMAGPKSSHRAHQRRRKCAPQEESLRPSSRRIAGSIEEFLVRENNFGRIAQERIRVTMLYPIRSAAA